VIGHEPAATPIGSAETHPATGEAVVAGNAAALSRRGGPVHADLVIAGVVIGFCAAMWGGTATFDDVPAALTQGMGPAAFPRLVLGVMAVLALWLAWTARGRPDPQREPVHRAVYLTGIAILAFMGVLTMFGIYAAILFACIGIGWLWGERRWRLLAATGVGLTVATHLIFVTAFRIPLPRGLIGSWLT